MDSVGVTYHAPWGDAGRAGGIGGPGRVRRAGCALHLAPQARAADSDPGQEMAELDAWGGACGGGPAPGARGEEGGARQM